MKKEKIINIRHIQDALFVYILPIAVIVVFILTLVLVYLPTLDSISAKDTGIEQENSRIAQLKQVDTTLSKYLDAGKHQELDNYLTQLTKSIPIDTSLAPSTSHVDDLAAKAGLMIDTLTAAQGQASTTQVVQANVKIAKDAITGLEDASVNFSFSGTVTAYLSFFKALYSDTRLHSVGDLKISGPISIASSAPSSFTLGVHNYDLNSKVLDQITNRNVTSIADVTNARDFQDLIGRLQKQQ